MSAKENEEQNTRQVGEALLSVATALQSVAQVMLGIDTNDKKKAAKPVKDPFAPKRNLTSYIFFVQEVRERIAQENPSLSAIDIARILGERWNALTDKEKQPYIKRAADDKARFEKEMAVYRKENGIPTPEPKKKKAAPAQTSKRAASPVAEAPVANKKKAKNSKPVEEKAEPKQDKKKGNKKR